MKFSDRLKQLRHEAKLSQMGLSNIVDITPAAIGHWEAERTEPSLEMLCKLSDYFGVTTDYLLGRSDKI